MTDDITPEERIARQRARRAALEEEAAAKAAAEVQRRERLEREAEAFNAAKQRQDALLKAQAETWHSRVKIASTREPSIVAVGNVLLAIAAIINGVGVIIAFASGSFAYFLFAAGGFLSLGLAAAILQIYANSSRQVALSKLHLLALLEAYNLE